MTNNFYFQDVLDLYVDELAGSENLIQLSVLRQKGTNNRVTARWRLSGEHNGVYDITPLSGVVSYCQKKSRIFILKFLPIFYKKMAR